VCQWSIVSARAAATRRLRIVIVADQSPAEHLRCGRYAIACGNGARRFSKVKSSAMLPRQSVGADLMEAMTPIIRRGAVWANTDLSDVERWELTHAGVVPKQDQPNEIEKLG